MEIMTALFAILLALGIVIFFTFTPVPKRFQKKELAEAKPEFNFEKKVPELYVWAIERELKTFKEKHAWHCSCPRCGDSKVKNGHYGYNRNRREDCITHEVTV